MLFASLFLQSGPAIQNTVGESPFAFVFLAPNSLNSSCSYFILLSGFQRLFCKSSFWDIPEQCETQLGKVAVLSVVDLNNAPWVLSTTNLTTVHDDLLLATDERKGKQGSQLAVLLNGLLIILLGVVREVVDWNVVVFDVLHDLVFRQSIS